MMKITSSASEAWIFIETIAKHGIESLECQYKQKQMEVLRSM